MGWYSTSVEGTYYESMPKVELHRHLEGSLRLSTLLEIAREQRLPLPQDEQLTGLVQMQSGEPLNFQKLSGEVSNPAPVLSDPANHPAR